jgi:hypothetical protein
MALTGIGIESYNLPLLDGGATQPNERSDSLNAAGEAVPDAPGGEGIPNPQDGLDPDGMVFPPS